MPADLIVTAEVMREMDRVAIEEYGVPGVALMENAGAGAARAILRYWPDAARVAVIAGGGNNGGDGYVIARHLINSGLEAVTYLISDRKKIKGDALTNLETLSRMNSVILDIKSEEDLGLLREALHGYDLVVDAMLGTGLTKPLKGLYASCVDMLNSSDVPVCSVDIPSGLSSDTGKPLGDAVRADLTCTYGLVKLGQVIYPGAAYVGDLLLVDIGMPRDVVEKLGGDDRLLMKENVRELFVPRDAEAHKGDFGHLLAVAASPGKTGAAAMCAESAVRSGAGLVTVVLPESLNAVLEAKLTEAMTLPARDDKGFLTSDAWENIKPALELADALAIGPGLGAEDSTRELFFKLVSEAGLPMVIDADGLNLLASDAGAIKSSGAKAVLTPHPGEMARLLGISSKEVQEDRVSAARRLAEASGAVVVLKGARSIIASPEGALAVNPTGNPGMASGGAGDVLTGIIGSLLGQGFEPFDAACAGTWIHGRAGDMAREVYGEIALKATDLIEALPDVFMEVLKEGKEDDEWPGLK